MIDRLGLYNTIFTNPTSKDSLVADTQRWKLAYDGLSRIFDAPIHNAGVSQDASLLRALLLRNDEEVYQAWILACLVPWANVENPIPVKPGKKPSPPVAATVIREGLKLDNKVMKVAADSVLHKGEIIGLVEDISTDDPAPASPSSKRKQSVPRRDTLGLAIRRWGTHWRSSFIFTLLYRLAELDEETGTHYCDLSCIARLN